jgi:hypothetical protein
MSIGINNYYMKASCEDSCSPSDNCPIGVTPDFVIKRFDTNPALRVELADCDGPMDVSDPNLAVEVNMWTKSKLKKNITNLETTFQFADNIAFNQILIGDIIYIDHARSPEYMQIVGINEDTKIITVSRGVNSTTPMSWKKGTPVYIYRIISGIGSIETVTQDVISITGSIDKNQLVGSNLIYDWSKNDTLTAGCYWLEFKLMKVIPQNSTIFSNFDSVLQYNVGDEPTLISPELILIDSEFNYKSSTFYLESKSSDYDYFIIKEDDNLTVELDSDDAGLITIVPTIYENDVISTIPLYDEGISTISISVYDNAGISIIPAIQPGMEIKTFGTLKYKGDTIGEFVAGGSNQPAIVSFNDNATQDSVQYVLNRFAIVNLSSAPQLWTRTIKYKLKNNSNIFSDSVDFYIGFNSMPSVQKLEGIEWIRRFPSCGEGFLIKVVNSITKEV